MMPLKEKLEIEEKNVDKIYLYKEGVFWRAYGVSCMLFYRMFPHFKILANKHNNKGYILLGVPDSKIESYHQKLIEKGVHLVNGGTGMLIPLEQDKEKRVYQTQEKISPDEYHQLLHTQLQKQRDKEKPTRILVISNERVAYLIQKIKNISLDELTPVDALVILRDLKDYIHELGI